MFDNKLIGWLCVLIPSFLFVGYNEANFQCWITAACIDGEFIRFIGTFIGVAVLIAMFVIGLTNLLGLGREEVDSNGD